MLYHYYVFYSSFNHCIIIKSMLCNALVKRLVQHPILQTSKSKGLFCLFNQTLKPLCPNNTWNVPENSITKLKSMNNGFSIYEKTFYSLWKDFLLFMKRLFIVYESNFFIVCEITFFYSLWNMENNFYIRTHVLIVLWNVFSAFLFVVVVK